ncbi:ovochymase-like [Amphiura filiformis]|uniref:ovochymase-like n=1 Tax=Amphiura filiformis TaxID=82378 RepID=UPI003B21A9A2
MDKQALKSDVENEGNFNSQTNQKKEYMHTNPTYEGYIDDDLDTKDFIDNKPSNKQKPLYKQPCFYFVILMVVLFAVGFGVAGFIAGYITKAKALYKMDANKDSNIGCDNQNIHLELRKPYILSALFNLSNVVEETYHCTWKVRAPQGTNITVKIIYLTDVFKLPYLEYILSFGSGSDPRNLTTVIKRITGDNQILPRIHTGYSELWFRYSGRINLNLDSRVFEIELYASDIPDIINYNMCGTTPALSNYKPRIIAGDDASDGAWPWIGSLRYTVPPHMQEHMCGASLVTSTLAITAAHCVDGLDISLKGIIFGSNKLDANSSTTVAVQVDKAFIHPDYSRQTYINDIAVLQLSQAVAWTDYVRPVCLQVADNEVEAYSTCYVAGWGQMYPPDRKMFIVSNTTHPNDLQEAAMNLVNADECHGLMNGIGSIQVTDADICTQSPNGLPSACYGDSGGPLMCLDDVTKIWRQVGIVSRGVVCNTTSYPNIFVRTSSHIDFVKSFTQDASLPIVKCKTVPVPCSQFLPYKQTTEGISNSVLQYIAITYNNLLNSTFWLDEMYLKLINSSSLSPSDLDLNQTTVNMLKETYEFIKASTFVDDYMTTLCASYFHSCSVDGPVLGPCRTICEDTWKLAVNYFSNITELFELDLDDDDFVRLSCGSSVPYSNNSKDQLCVQGVDIPNAICGEQDISLFANKAHFLIAMAPNFRSLNFYQKCSWIVTASPLENVIIKIIYLSTSFKRNTQYEQVIAIGYGKDSRRLDTLIMRVTKYISPLPPALFIDYSEVWIRYNNFFGVDSHIFTIQFISTPLHDLHSVCDSLTNCANDSCVISSWRCDNVVDCPGSPPIDETGCTNVTNVTADNTSASDATNSSSEEGTALGSFGHRAGSAGDTHANPNSQGTNLEICGTTPAARPVQRIINGNDVTAGRWPWIGSIRKRGSFHEHHCGAVLIASQWALTAAHCLKNPTLYEVTVESVVFGDIDLDENSASHVEVEIEKVYSHPMYNTISSWNDLAILKLARPVPLSTNVRPICSHPSSNETIYSTCYTAGWGMQTFVSNENRSTVLQDVAVNIVDSEACRVAYRNQEPYQTALDNELCYVSVAANQSPCYGDSGGPVMCLDPLTSRWNLLGIVSHTINCNIDNTPGLAVRVSRYLPYISSVITTGEGHSQCESIEGPCADILPYTMTSFGLQTGLNPIFEALFSNNVSDCHPDYKYFVCASVYYDCISDSRVREPCESFCRDILVTSNCSHAEDRIDRFYIMQTCSQFPSGYNASQKLCRTDLDAACTPEKDISLTLNEPSLLNSIGYPEYKVSYVDCVWVATAPAEAKVLIKFRALDFQESMEALTIGIGDDSQNRLSIILKSWEFEETPSLVFTGSRVAWIRYATYLPYERVPKGFLLEMWASNAIEDDILQLCQDLEPNNPLNISPDIPNNYCNITSRFPPWWRCDRVVDCPNGADEHFCSESDVERHMQLVTEVFTEVLTQLSATEESVTEQTTPWLHLNATVSGIRPNIDFEYPYTCGISQRSYSRRIVGGTDARDGDWPWLVGLRGSTDVHYVCGGTLISSHWVITAAHCIDYISTAVIGTTLSALNSTTNDHIEISIENVYPLPDYDPTTHEGDIALVKLSSSVHFDDSIQPVCLGTSTLEGDAYVGCSILGWGRLSEGGVFPSGLQVATVPLLLPSQCNVYVPEVTDNMLCAGRPEGGVDSCQGDSGGPLLCVDELDRWYIVGITSFGSGCARPNSPGVYTRISKYHDFINSTLHHY